MRPFELGGIDASAFFASVPVDDAATDGVNVLDPGLSAALRTI
jgi:hypothetical protein